MEKNAEHIQENVRYLEHTSLLDYEHKRIQKLIKKRKWKELPEFDRIKAIYNYVRDEILFGYNKDDNIPASKVLKDGYGQCNTKGILFMALLKACGIPCRVHGFTIDKKLQKGAMTLLATLMNAWVIQSYTQFATSGFDFSNVVSMKISINGAEEGELIINNIGYWN